MAEEFAVRTSKGRQLIDITDEVSARVKGKEGICLIYVPHATAGLIINEDESNLASDFEKLFERLAPKNEKWAHNKIDDNAHAHLLSGLVSPSVCVPVVNGKLALGTWQRILLCEFDGPRERKVMVVVR